MAGFVANKVAKHILKENSKNHFGTEDPYFDYVTPHDLNGNPGKVKKTKKAAPPGITVQEAKILKKVTRRAYRLDNCFSVCGIRVGWGAIFGLIPALGDIFDLFMAMMVYRTICQAEVPASLKSKMIFNIVADFAVGLVPFLGDVADAVFRANTRNAALLYGHLRERGAARIKAGTHPDTGSGKTSPPRERSRSHGRAGTQMTQTPVVSPTANTHTSNQKSDLASPNKARAPAGSLHGQTTGTIPVDKSPALQSPVSAKTNNGNKGGWLSRFGGGAGSTSTKTREPDLEAGENVQTR